MRILQISSAKTFGGEERHFVVHYREIESRGNEVFVGIRPTNWWQERLGFCRRGGFLPNIANKKVNVEPVIRLELTT